MTMTLDRNLHYIIFTALQVGDFDTALPWLEAFSSDQISELTLPDQRTPLHYACQHGRVDVVQRLITNCQCSIESKDVQGCTPLHTAAQYGQVETLKYLLHRLFNHEVSGLTVKLTPGGKLSHTLASKFQQKLSDRHRDQSDNTPLHTACVHGRLDIVQLFTSIGCDLIRTNKDGLSLAAQHGHLALVRYLVEEVGSDMTLQNKHGRSPTYLAAGGGHPEIMMETKRGPQFKTNKAWSITKLNMAPDRSLVHTASREGHLHVVRYLVEHHGCDPSCTDEEGITPLHLACQEGHIDIVSYLTTEARCDPNCASEDGKTCLHAASIGGSLDVIKYLHIKHNCMLKCDLHGRTPAHYAAAPDVLIYLIEDMIFDRVLEVQYALCPDENRQTPLHRAAAEGKLEVVKYFAIFHQCNLLVEDKFSNTPLHLSALNGHLDVVKFLTESMNCDPNIQSHCGRTPLHIASQNGHLDVVKYLVDTYNSDPLCPDIDKLTPLHGAAANGQLEVIRYFANAHETKLVIEAKDGSTPLHLAALLGHLDVVKFLTENMKCDPNLMGQNKTTPLHAASKRGHLDVVKYLVDTHNCNPLTPDHYQNTPLHCASLYGHLPVVHFFTNTLKCSILVMNTYNNTPLHVAASRGQLAVVRYFTSTLNCSIRIKNIFNNTPLNDAASHGHLEVVKFFIEGLNCDPNIQGRSGMTPLHSSLRNKHFEVAMYLISLPSCDVTAKHYYSNLPTNPLHFAVETQNLELISYLCNTRRLDPHLQPDKEKLLEAAKDPAVLEFVKNYTDPLHYAAIYGDLETVKHYVEREKWDPMKEDRFGNNTLHNAALHGQLEVVKFLTGLNKDPLNQEVEILCDPLVKNKYGLTAQDIASQNGHRHVVSYLLRASSLQPVFQQDAISPPFNILVVGNSGSGKSTLVKALTAENDRFGRITKVKGVIPHTAGILLTTLHSPMYGEVNIYDFAGHEEYYASHEMILQQTAQPLVLLVVNVSLPKEEIQKQILYWLAILTSSFFTDATTTIHVLVIGSHADQIKFRNKIDICKQISSLVSKYYSLKYHGYIQCDCRYSVSYNLNKLRLKLSKICRSIRLFLAHESEDSNSLCAALMTYMKKEGPENVTITVHDLHKSISDSLAPSSKMVLLVDQTLLLETCKKLSSMGHVLFLPHDKNKMEGVLVVDKHTILSKVHACLQAKKDMTNGIGVIEEEHLKHVLSDLLEGIMEPTQAIKYLTFSQFCTEIVANQLISVPQGFEGLTHYFFPSLASTLKPDAALLLGDGDYTHLYTWGLKCTDSHQFLTPRYLHSLFIQLTKCEGDAANTRFNIWKNGILLVHVNGTRSIIEVTDQTTHLYLTMQCVKGCELNLLKHRSKLISLIKSLLGKSCPLLTFDEFLLLPHATYPLDISNQIPLADIAHSVLGSHPTVLFDYNHIPLRDLLHWDPFHVIDEPSLQELFCHRYCMCAISSSTLSLICSSIEGGCEAFAKGLSVQASTQQITYDLLYQELSQYSIFTDGNLYVSLIVSTVECIYLLHHNNKLQILTGVTIPPCEKTHDPDAELPSRFGLGEFNLIRITHRYKNNLICVTFRCTDYL